MLSRGWPLRRRGRGPVSPSHKYGTVDTRCDMNVDPTGLIVAPTLPHGQREIAVAFRFTAGAAVRSPRHTSHPCLAETPGIRTSLRHDDPVVLLVSQCGRQIRT